MKLTRVLLTLAVAGILGGVAYVAQQVETPGLKMARAADQFLTSLKADQKKTASIAFDSPERTNWNFVPLQDAQKKSTRKGLALQDMTPEQRQRALDLLATGTSMGGKQAAVTIMTLESILHDLEKGGSMVRDPDWYFVTIFGTPSNTDSWGWRIEGHHLSLNYTVKGGQVVSGTPSFFGANPALVKASKRKGVEALPQAENLARKLFVSLNDQQRDKALQPKHFPEPEQNTVKPNVGKPVGVSYGDLGPEGQKLLRDLVISYAERMPQEISKVQLREVFKEGLQKITFAWTGGSKPGDPHTYRVQGPTFVIEFLNTQGDSAGNPANHIHSVWRRLAGDFGEGL